jgi:succinoglycan biosynthesis transport protein ExoP
MNRTQQRRLDESFDSDLRAIFALLRQRAWLLVACVLVAGIAGAVYIIRSPKVYRAQAVIQVEKEQKVVKGDAADSQDFKGEEIPKTIEQSLTSPELLLGLIARNDLNKDPAFLPGLKRPVSDSKIAEEMTKHISAQVRRGTWLIDIKVEDHNPIMAQKIADLLVKEFVYEGSIRNMEAWEAGYHFLLQQSESVKARLTKSEEALQTYKEQHRLVALGEKENVVVAKLDELNRMLTEANAKRIKLEADYGQIKKRKNSPPATLLEIPSIGNSPAIVELEKTVAEKEAEVASLTETFKHPIHTGATMQLQELKAGLDRIVLKTAEQVTSEYESAAATEEKMEAALQDQEDVALEQNRTSIPYNALRQDVESDRSLYESITTRLKEGDMSKDVAQDAIRVVSHPLLPERPVSPDKKRIMLLSLFGGLALGCGLTLLSRVLNASLKTVDEAERRLGLPALGVIPKCARPKWLTDDLLLVEQPGSAAAECFRTLRTSLSLLGKNAGHKAFLFTSAVASEGKSFCAINCAVAFAQQGLNTLLIDADLRSPSIGRISFDGAPAQGLTEILTHRTNLDETIWLTNINKLSVLCAGTELDTPAELLAGEGFGQLITKVMAKFDRVVVDSAPIHPVSDTLLLVGHVQVTCLVVSTKTSAEVVYQAVRKLTDAGSTLVGFIFNRVSRQHGSDYGYRYSQAALARANSGNSKRSPKPILQLERPELHEL